MINYLNTLSISNIMKTAFLIVLLLSIPFISAEQLTIMDGNKELTITSFAGTATDPRRGFDPVESEQFRNKIKSGVENLAEQHLPAVAAIKIVNKEGEETSAPSLAGIMFGVIFGSADKAKTNARDNLKEKAKFILKDARLNVVVGTTKPERNTQQDVQETVYLIIHDYHVEKSGIGTLNSPTATISITDYATFDQLTSGKIDIREAVKSGKIQFAGSGIVNRWRAQVFSWFSKYS